MTPVDKAIEKEIKLNKYSSIESINRVITYQLNALIYQNKIILTALDKMYRK